MARPNTIKMICLVVFVTAFNIQNVKTASAESLCSHIVMTDAGDKIMPWYQGTTGAAYDNYLEKLWEWLPVTGNGHCPLVNGYPMYYFYCAFSGSGDPNYPYDWENDWGERIPNFVEFAGLYYAYTGDINHASLTTSKAMADYAYNHAITPANFVWPNFPYGTGVSGSTTINGQNCVWNPYDILIDLGADMGMSFYKLYLIYGPTAGANYRTAAINTADTLAAKIQTGDATHSPWPYVVNAQTGSTVSNYCSNWAGALTLFDLLIEHGEPHAATYATARTMLKNWIFAHPMQDGKWIDSHSDIRMIDGKYNGVLNLSNMSKSNMNLYLLDNPVFYQPVSHYASGLLQWTETNMVAASSGDGLYGSTGVYKGAHVPFEQTGFNWRMGYQTARQAAEYAGCYALTNNETYKDRAFRGFNYNTYMMDTNGKSADGPTSGVGYWFGDCWGEAPRMYFYGFMACPEWAPAGENHILYSHGIIQSTTYAENSVSYTPTDGVNVTYSGQEGVEYLRLKFMPNSITANNVSLSLRTDLNGEGYTRRDLGSGDYAVAIKRMRAGPVIISGTGITPIPNTATSTKTNTRTATPMLTRTATRTQTSTYTITPTTTQTPVVSQTQTCTTTRTGTITPTRTITLTRTATRTQASTYTITPTFTQSSIVSPPPSRTITSTRTASSTRTFTRTRTPIRSVVPTSTQTPLLSHTPIQTPTATPRMLEWSEKAIIIFPNPAAGLSVTIQFQAENAGPAEVVVHNVAGRLVSRRDISIASPGRQTVQYKVDKLVNGVYVVTIRQAGKSLGIKRLVVKRAGK